MYKVRVDQPRHQRVTPNQMTLHLRVIDPRRGLLLKCCFARSRYLDNRQQGTRTGDHAELKIVDIMKLDWARCGKGLGGWEVVILGNHR